MLSSHYNMDRFGQKDTRRLKRIKFDGIISDPDFSKRYLKKLTNGERGVKDLDWDYVWYIDFRIEREDQNEYENEKEKDVKNEEDTENENDSENEDEDIHVDENSKDPELCLFLENLTEHRKSYKLNISQNDEEPVFIFYEEPENSDCCDGLQTCTDDSGDEVTVSEDMQVKPKPKRRLNEKSGRIYTKKQVSKRKKINDHKTILDSSSVLVFSVDLCYNKFINGAVECQNETVEYEKNVTTYDSDSDVVILDNVQNCSEVNNKQLVLAEKQPSLREKLMHILEHPYDEDEHKELSEYIMQEKPVSQLRPLRNGRARLYANAGVNKSVLSYGPDDFRRKLNAAQKDPPKALNLLRMFRFWLEHVPNVEVFQPWRDKHMLKVRPSEKNALTYMPPQQLLLEDK